MGLVACRVSDLVDSPQSGARLQFSVQPTSVKYGEPISPAVKVSVLNEAGQTDVAFVDSVVIALAPNATGAVVTGTTVVAADAGVATFDDLEVDRPGRGYVLQASARQRPMALSEPFEVMEDPPPPPPQATRLAFVVPPSNVQAGSVIAPAVQVAAQDNGSSTVTSYTGTITLAIGDNPGGGALSGTTSAVAANGIASFANLRISEAGNGYTLTAAASGLTGAASAAFNVTAQPPPPPPPATQLAFIVQPTTTEAGSNITPPVQVAARDASGNLVPTYSGTITVAIGNNPSGGSLAGTLSSVASNGVATFASLRISQAGNGYTLTAAASGLTGATSAAFNVTAPPPPTVTAIVVTPATASLQTGGTQQFSATATLSDGSTQTNPSVTWSATGGTINTTGFYTAGSSAGSFRVIAASGNGHADTSAVTLTAPPPPPATQLAFTVQPTTTEAGGTITPAVRVAARDASGNVVTGYTGTITVAIGSNPGGGTLAGTTSSVASAGIATFTGLRIDQAGNGYTLTAAASGLSGATSATFDITAPPPPPPQATGLRFIVQPSNTRVNQPINPPVQVMAVDANGNQVTGFSGAITVDLAPNVLGASAYGTLTVNAVNGIATFSNIRINLVGVDFRLRAMFAGQTPVVTSNAFIVLL